MLLIPAPLPLCSTVRYVCLWRAARRLEQAIQEDDASTAAGIITTYAARLVVSSTA